MGAPESRRVDGEQLVWHAPDHALCRINALDFAGGSNLGEERVIAGFLQATRLGLFDLLWNILCPSCGGVLDTNATLKTITRPEYRCAFCAAGYEPILDEVVEVTFTVNPRLRAIAMPATFTRMRARPCSARALRMPK